MANQQSEIERLIGEIEDYLNSCRKTRFSQDKISVSRDEIFDYLDELKMKTPQEIKRYRKIIANRDNILAKARKEAEDTVNNARAQADQIIEESALMEEAYARVDAITQEAESNASRILSEANADANTIRSNALEYAAALLGEVQKVVEHSFETTRVRNEALLDSLNGSLEVLGNNRDEILSELAGTNINAGGEEDYEDVNEEPAEDEGPSYAEITYRQTHPEQDYEEEYDEDEYEEEGEEEYEDDDYVDEGYDDGAAPSGNAVIDDFSNPDYEDMPDDVDFSDFDEDTFLDGVDDRDYN